MQKDWRLATVQANARVESESGVSGFHDKRSRQQIAMYVAHRLLASDERNLRALARWNDNVRQQWELEHLGATRRIT